MSLLHNLNTKQQEAIKAAQGPVMVVAGPGSGKTRVLTHRIAYLISIGVPAYQILTLTFTNKAANEMKERITKLVGEKSRQIWMGTFHSIFARLLRMECEAIGFSKNFSIYDSQDSLALIKNIMDLSGISIQRFNPVSLRSKISSAKNRLLSPQDLAQQAIDVFEEKTAQVYAEYQSRLKQYNAMDFDDLLLKPIDLFSHHKKILTEYQDRFRFILIDEYQDTNHAQYRLVKLLADKYRNICVVGDDAQSIYAFRGADIRNILDFKRDYPDAVTVRLEQNYRSTKTILAASDSLIKHNVDQLSKDLWTDNDEGDTISLISCDDDKDEGATIVSKIFDECRHRKLDMSSFAVMYRTNAQSRSLEDALRRNTIPYVIVGGVEFYQRKEVKDTLAYLRVLVNPQDRESFLRIVNYPTRGLGDVALARLQEFADQLNINLLEASVRAGEIESLAMKARNSLHSFAAMIQKYKKLSAEISITELSRAYIEEIGILRIFKDEGTPEAMARWENVQEVLSAITEFASQHDTATLDQFLQEISLVSDLDQLNDKRNAVTLMTLHSAKGLEFPVVFIAGLEEGLLPFYNSSIERKELEEERRLFYVGMTRAMQKLFLTHTRSRFRFGEVSYQSPSRFIEEVGTQFISEENTGRSLMSRREFSHTSSGYRPATKQRGMRDIHSFFPDEQPDYEHQTDQTEHLRVGILVHHDTFGKGKVVHLGGEGEEQKAVIDFQGIGRKNLLLKYARLKVL